MPKRITKLLRIIIPMILLSLFNTAMAQMPTKQMDVRFNKVPLSEVLRFIRAQTGFNFMYSNQQLNDKKVVNIDRTAVTTEQVLKILLGPGYTWTVKDKTITIFRQNNKTTALDTLPSVKMGSTIRGQVFDEQGAPLVGASVSIGGSESAVKMTDKSGNFQFDRFEGGNFLEISYIGYETMRVPITNQLIKVTMRPSDAVLTDVVVIGYGSVQRKDLTGSVAQVNMEDLNKAPVVSFTEALAGRVAGVKVSSSDGQPGSGQDIVIRGASSLTQSNAPLYVVDGFPLESLDAAALNNDDIESINILKDASATAIYGARAANGVVVITTKKGKVKKMEINFSSSWGFQNVRKKMEMLTPYEFIQYNLELKPSVTQTRYLDGVGKTLDDYKNVEGIDWQDQILSERPVTAIHNISLRGGNAQTRYAFSGSITDQEGVILHSGHKRYQGRMTLDHNISKKLKVGMSTNYGYREVYGKPVSTLETEYNPTTSLLYRVWAYRPVTGSDIDILQEEEDPENISNNDIRLNPVITNENEYYRRYVTDNISNGYMEYKILHNLTFRITGGINKRIQRNESFFNSKTTQGSPKNPQNTRGQWGTVSYSERTVLVNENTLNFDHQFSKNQTLNLLGGFSTQKIATKANGATSTHVPNEELGISGLDEGVASSTSSSSSTSSLVSYFLRANYNFASRFLLTATIRGDASSKFAPEYRWGYFPSGAIAWNIGNEKFLKNSKVISTAKIRLSHGITGNNRVSDFAYLASLNMNNSHGYSFNNATPSNGVIIDDLGNKQLKWESTAQTDAGIDLGFFNDRIELTVDVYEKKTHDLLFQADIPYTSGYSKAYMNIGKIQNRGLEISLNTVNIQKKNFSWESNFNISFNRNKILALANGQVNMFNFAQLVTQYNNSPLYISQVGMPAGMMYGYIYEGAYQYEDFNEFGGNYVLKPNVPTNGNDRGTIKPGDIKYRDLNGDGVVDSYDQAIIGNGVPKHFGGLSNNFTYKNFSLNLFFQWSYGNDIYNANRLFFEGNTLLGTDLNQYRSILDRWSPENPTNRNFRPGGQGPAGRHSSRVIEDGSYLRLKTAAINYSIPAKTLKRTFIRSLSFNLSAQNMLTWTNYSGLDPEVSTKNNILTPGFDFSAYPHSRTIVVGIKAGF